MWIVKGNVFLCCHHTPHRSSWLVFFSWLAFAVDLEDGAVRSHLKECLKTILDNNVAQVRICKPVIHIISRRENKLENCSLLAQQLRC